jgi:predicted enzyme related to lactoylglutathione lyase
MALTTSNAPRLMAQVRPAALGFVFDHLREGQMKRVTGIGGIFFKAKDPAALGAWYKKHLGIDVQEWGGAAFDWTDESGKPTGGTTAWSLFSAAGDQFAPSTSSFMVNYRVADLHSLLKALRAEGCHVLEKTDDSEYGKFGWVLDPEGNKVELWQPPEGQ